VARKGKGGGSKGCAEEPPNLGALHEMWQLGGSRNMPLHLVLVAKLIDRYISGLLATHSNLTLAEWRVVAQLSILQQSTVRKMARQACVDPAEVSRSAAALVKRGLVKRADNDKDRRSPQFSLTSRGAAEFAKFRPHWETLSRTLLERVDAADLAAFERGLARFARACLDLLGE
jgi:DNA-binding MarR family transcriptional regulator